MCESICFMKRIEKQIKINIKFVNFRSERQKALPLQYRPVNAGSIPSICDTIITTRCHSREQSLKNTLVRCGPKVPSPKDAHLKIMRVIETRMIFNYNLKFFHAIG